MDFRRYLYTLSTDSIENLSKVDSSGGVNNVLSGINNHCFGFYPDNDERMLNFFYVNGSKELIGYLFKLKFKQEDFYEQVMAFCYFLSVEFEGVDCVSVYNTYLQQFQSVLEMMGWSTISAIELREMKERTNDSCPTILASGPVEVIQFLTAKEFYQNILGLKMLPAIRHDSHYVYLILNTRNGYFKIGRSKNPLNREKTLQAEEPEIMLLYLWEREASFEKQLHAMFSKKQVRGEWFKLNVADVLKLKEVADEKY